MTAPIFTQPDTWTGASYDLAIELGPRDDDRLRAALRAVWSHRDVEGCYARPDVEPSQQQRLGPATEFDEKLYGLARIGDLAPLACLSVVIRYDDGVDWIYFGLAPGSLCRAFGDIYRDVAWQQSIDHWLCDLGRHVYRLVSFQLGIVGEDGGIPDDATTFHEHGVPDERPVGYLVPERGDLRWCPSNRRES